MTEEVFRALALGLPDTEERSHWGHPDFRVRGKIVATLRYPATGWGTVKLTVNQQEMVMALAPEAFLPVKGVWGTRGATSVVLKKAGKKLTSEAMRLAWGNIHAAPGRGNRTS